MIEHFETNSKTTIATTLPTVTHNDPLCNITPINEAEGYSNTIGNSNVAGRRHPMSWSISTSTSILGNVRGAHYTFHTESHPSVQSRINYHSVRKQWKGLRLLSDSLDYMKDTSLVTCYAYLGTPSYCHDSFWHIRNMHEIRKYDYVFLFLFCEVRLNEVEKNCPIKISSWSTNQLVYTINPARAPPGTLKGGNLASPFPISAGQGLIGGGFY